jgi:hypothetical protein
MEARRFLERFFLGVPFRFRLSAPAASRFTARAYSPE